MAAAASKQAGLESVQTLTNHEEAVPRLVGSVSRAAKVVLWTHLASIF